jgi:N-acyl-phosphatidylethanolamine-hydrolysing phospholipase D
MVIERLTTRRAPTPPDGSFPAVRPAHAPQVVAPHVAVTWVGHSTFLVQFEGVNLLFDPIWSARASPLPFAGPRRVMPPAVALDALPTIDVVLVSHNHYDHLDHRTVEHLAGRHRDAAWYVPLGVAPLVRSWGARQVSALDWWDEAACGDLRVTCVPAQHSSARSLTDRERTLWCGWSLAGPTRRAYYAGDTGYHPEFATIGARCGPYDVAFLPIGGYDPRWFMRPVHMSAEEAVAAYRDLCAPHGAVGTTVMVPMHWGTFRLTDEPMDEPPRRARAAWEAAGLAADALWVLAHGETRWF